MAKMRLKPINPGELNRVITFQTQTSVTGSGGFPTDVWVDSFDVMARKVDLRGDERFSAGQLSSPFDTMWQTWYREDLDPDLIDVQKEFRIVHRSRIYDIVRVAPIEMWSMRHGIEIETIAKGRIEA